MEGVKEFIKTIPPLTRTFMGGTMLLSFCMTYKIVSPYWGLLMFPDAFTKLQLWRLVSCFFYAGPFGMGFLFKMWMMHFSCSALDKYFGETRQPEMLTMVLFNAVMCILFGWLADMYQVLQDPLMFSFVYVWSKLEPDWQISMWGFPI
jgi:Derlin-2/3